ncbi:YicC/YloC family endoribonuclease [Insolitispirillum peregrinum]|uniref:YicC/YloC family endoribonuclease n=1 Tax=Insolitispirillum peregrinum TaxID=80876 RepID=UPI00361BE8C6
MIASMTGFARCSGPASPQAPGWVWEARSVNGKGLDVRLRLPSGYEDQEGPCRDMISKALGRGNVSVSLNLHGQPEGAAAAVAVNSALLQQLMEMARDLPPHIAPPTFDGLLAVRGVLMAADEQDISPTDREQHTAALRAGLVQVLNDLKAARAEEGQRLEAVLRGQLATIQELVGQAEQTAALRADSVRGRLQRQISDVLDMLGGEGTTIPEDRLVQEVALIVTRLDVREELDRLRAHLAQADDLLSKGGACGRRLDFLCQEFNREANTLCSKAQDTDLTRIGLELKAVIDQLREQVQNVE